MRCAASRQDLESDSGWQGDRIESVPGEASFNEPTSPKAVDLRVAGRGPTPELKGGKDYGDQNDWIVCAVGSKD